MAILLVRRFILKGIVFPQVVFATVQRRQARSKATLFESNRYAAARAGNCVTVPISACPAIL